MKKAATLLLALGLLFTAGCGPDGQTGTGAEKGAYARISQAEAMEMMARDDGHVIVDVRRQDEYDAGHIPGAILIPNESIGCDSPEALPDYDQIILIYCRTGNRSKQAAEKLAAMGYTNVYEFGGIADWTGEIVTTGEEPMDAPLDAPNHTAEEENSMNLTIGETRVPVTWENNESVEELRTLLPLTIHMSMYGGFEQVGPIGRRISRSDEQTVTESGDIVLYSGDQIVIFYGSNTWSYTRLGHVELTRQEMADLLSHGNVTITLSGD